MYEIKKLEKKQNKFSGQPYVSEFEKNLELSIGEVNGHFYLKIKSEKSETKKMKKKAKKMEPSCYDLMPKYDLIVSIIFVTSKGHY